MAFLKVALVVPEYRTEVAPGGGIATVTDFVANSIQKLRPDWQFEVVSPRMWHRAPESQRLASPRTWMRGARATLTTAGGWPVRYVGSYAAEFEFMRYRSRRALTRILDRFDVVIVISGSPAPFLLTRNTTAATVGYVATIMAEERARLSTSGPLLRRTKALLNGKLTQYMDSRGVRVPGQVIAMNPVLQAWCEREAGRMVHLIPGGVDLAEFSVAKACPSQPSHPYLLSVGRLGDPRKDISRLIRCYHSAVNDHGVEQHLVLAGNQLPPQDALRSINQLGLEDRIHIVRSPSRADLVRLYVGADLFVMSSREEGLGMVQLEAHAAGLPVVSTRTAGAAFIMGSRSAGQLVDLGDDVEAELSLAIAQFANSPGRRSVASAEALEVVQRFSSDVLGTQIVELLETASRTRLKN